MGSSVRLEFGPATQSAVVSGRCPGAVTSCHVSDACADRTWGGVGSVKRVFWRTAGVVGSLGALVAVVGAGVKWSIIVQLFG